MATGDDWGFSDNISDPFEARELQNGFLNGAAGSPFSGYPDRSMFADQFSQYYRGNPHAIDLGNFGLPGGGAKTAGLMDGSLSTPVNVAVNGAEYGVLSASRLSDFHIPDITSLSVFSPEGLPMCHGLPIHQGNGFFSTTGGDMGTSSGFGSFASVSGGPTSQPAAFGSSFGSASTGGHGPLVDQVSGLGIAGDAWQSTINVGTMSPKDLPLKRMDLPETFDDRSPELLFGHERDEELDPESDSDEEEAAKMMAAPDLAVARKATHPPSSKGTNAKQRKILPDKAPRISNAVARKRTPEAKPRPAHSPREPAPSTAKAKAKAKAKAIKTSDGSPTSLRVQKKSTRPSPRKILPSPRMANPRPARSSPSDTREATREPRPISPSSSRSAKDEFLLASKQKGMTYREIREAGRFTEAESTLRGRFRTLTKSKEERVRKPEWSDKDIQLLHKAVRVFGRQTDSDATVKVPWKQVAEYIHDRGGSYLFGNATCRKKWDELVMDKVREEEQ